MLRHHAWILLVAVVVLFTNLGAIRLWDRDEPRNAGCAQEMLDRGDYVVPYFNGEVRGHKPVLLYWLMMAAYQLFGVSEFSARLASALLGVGTVLMTYHMGRRMFSPRAGLLSAIILATSLMFDVAARAATPDSVLIFFSTAAVFFFVMGAFPARDPQAPEHPDPHEQRGAFVGPSELMYGLCYASMGLAALAKGPIGVLLPTAVIGLFMLYRTLPKASAEAQPESPPTLGGRLLAVLRPYSPNHIATRAWLMRPITLVVVVLAVAGPWYLWVDIRSNGVWTHQFFNEHNFGRATTAMENHGGPFYYYLVVVLVGFFPWSVFIGPTLIDATRRLRRGDAWASGYLLCFCWAALYIVAFSMAKTKLPSYITPCYPALAMLTGCFIDHWSRGRSLTHIWWRRASFASLATAGLGIAVGVPIAAHFFLPQETILGLVGVIPIAAAAICWWLSERGRLQPAAVTMAVGATLTCVALFGFAQVRIDRHQISERIIDTATSHGEGDARLIAFGDIEPSFAFYAGGPIPALPAAQAAQFLNTTGDGSFVVTTDRNYERLKPHLPEGVVVLDRGKRFLKKGEILLLGSQTSRTAVRTPGVKTSSPR